MHFFRLTDSRDAYFAQAMALYAISFPHHEQRQAASQCAIMSHPEYHFTVVLEGEDFVGDILWWETEDFCYVEHFCKAGADYLTIHVEADTPENTMAALEKIAELGVKPGIVVKPNTPAEAIAPYLEKVAMVLVMTVEPGFGGQKFMAHMMPKVKQLREMLDKVNPSCHLEVDGGVDLTTAEICKENGANVFVAGSAFYGAADRAAFCQKIEA